MAKADDTISDWIWLHEALTDAVAAFGSRELAERRLRQWLTAGELPWDCMDWEGLDDEGLAKLKQSLEGSGAMLLAPSAAYYNGDPRFWAANLAIGWEVSTARESAPMTPNGAQALGIKVPLARLRVLLPGETRENEQVRGAGAWTADEVKRMKNAKEIPPDIRISDFARELESRMLKAADKDKFLRPIKWRSIKNGLRAWGLWPIDSIK